MIPFRRQKKREKEARKKNLKRARAASLGNAFSEIEQLLAFTVNPRAEQEEDTEEVTLEKIEECQEMLKSLQSRPWPMTKKLQVLQEKRAVLLKFEGKLSKRGQQWEAIKRSVHNMKRSYDNFLTSLVPWDSRIKRVESYFGSSVTSFFT